MLGDFDAIDLILDSRACRPRSNAVDRLGRTQCRSHAIWDPGANIHYGAPFFSTKRSTGLLFTVQGSLRFFWVFRQLRAIETFQSSHLIFCNIARSYSNHYVNLWHRNQSRTQSLCLYKTKLSSENLIGYRKCVTIDE